MNDQNETEEIELSKDELAVLALVLVGSAITHWLFLFSVLL